MMMWRTWLISRRANVEPLLRALPNVATSVVAGYEEIKEGRDTREERLKMIGTKVHRNVNELQDQGTM